MFQKNIFLHYDGNLQWLTTLDCRWLICLSTVPICLCVNLATTTNFKLANPWASGRNPNRTRLNGFNGLVPAHFKAKQPVVEKDSREPIVTVALWNPAFSAGGCWNCHRMPVAETPRNRMKNERMWATQTTVYTVFIYMYIYMCVCDMCVCM